MCVKVTEMRARTNDSQSCHSDSVPPTKRRNFNVDIIRHDRKFPLRSIDLLIKTGKTGKRNSSYKNTRRVAVKQRKKSKAHMHFSLFTRITCSRKFVSEINRNWTRLYVCTATRFERHISPIYKLTLIQNVSTCSFVTCEQDMYASAGINETKANDTVNFSPQKSLAITPGQGVVTLIGNYCRG